MDGKVDFYVFTNMEKHSVSALAAPLSTVHTNFGQSFTTSYSSLGINEEEAKK